VSQVGCPHLKGALDGCRDAILMIMMKRQKPA
jgi:hypothetical protein